MIDRCLGWVLQSPERIPCGIHLQKRKILRKCPVLTTGYPLSVYIVLRVNTPYQPVSEEEAPWICPTPIFASTIHWIFTLTSLRALDGLHHAAEDHQRFEGSGFENEMQEN
jgi:hypothetical protein